MPELDKPAGRWCRHIAQGRGCGIHATRPPVCRAFFCQWIENPELGPEWKPERCKFVLSVYPGSNALAVTADPAAPRAWAMAPYHATLRRWAQAALEQGSQVIAFVGTQATLILPDRDLPLGALGPGDAVRVRRNGFSYEASVERSAS